MKQTVLIDKYLPEYTFSKFHEIVVNCPIENVCHVAKDVELSKSKFITPLFKTRRLPIKRLNLQNFITDMGFTNLEENYPYENLIGFWTKAKSEKILDYEAFLNDPISPCLKAVWNFKFEKLEAGKAKVSTETRVLCVAAITKFTFGLYWLIIKPFSGITRKKMLNIIKNDAEALESIDYKPSQNNLR